MPRYTVYVEEDLGEHRPPFEYGAYDDLLEAEDARRAAELSYPNGAVWIQNEKGNEIPHPPARPK